MIIDNLSRLSCISLAIYEQVTGVKWFLFFLHRVFALAVVC